MTKQHINTPNAPQPGAYSQAVLVDCGSYFELLMAGQTGNMPDGKDEPVILGGIGPQTTRTLENILAVIQSVGGQAKHILKLNILLRDPVETYMSEQQKGEARKNQRLVFNQAYVAFFEKHSMTRGNGNLPARVLAWFPEVPLEKPTEETEIEIDPVKVIIPKDELSTRPR